MTQRKEEIRTTVAKLSAALVAGKIKPVIGPQGGIAFQGWADQDRNRVTDACALRQLMSSGSALAMQAIQKAEMLAGRKIDRQQVAQGTHAHSDGRGGLVWHDHK